MAKSRGAFPARYRARAPVGVAGGGSGLVCSLEGRPLEAPTGRLRAAFTASEKAGGTRGMGGSAG